jgi:hypothetical protein
MDGTRSTGYGVGKPLAERRWSEFVADRFAGQGKEAQRSRMPQRRAGRVRDLSPICDTKASP